MMNVIVTGTLGFDYIMNYSGQFVDRIMPDKIHQLSLSFLVDHLTKNVGGTAGNIAYTLKLLGTDPLLLSTAGNDFAPYRKLLEEKNISTEHIKEYADVITGSYFVITDTNHSQIGSFYSGATKYAPDLSIGNIVRGQNKKFFVIIAPTDPAAMKKYVTQCQQLNLTYMYDPAFQIGDFTPVDLKQAIKGAAMLIGNDYEITLIEQKLKVTHQELIKMVPIVITTLADKGSLIETSGKRQAESVKKIMIKPAKPESTADPTGAGDAYRAGFVAGYIRGFNLEMCGQMGSLAAVYTVEKYGTQTHEFTRKEFTKRYHDNYNALLRIS